MQIIPSVAKKIAKNHNIKYSNFEDLYNPQINIKIGTKFLKNLIEKYNRQYIITAASYNASEEAILNWIKTRYVGNPLEFIEDIPYKETRLYIKISFEKFYFL